MIIVVVSIFSLSTTSIANDDPIFDYAETCFPKFVITQGHVYRGSFDADGKNFYFFHKTGDGATAILYHEIHQVIYGD